MIISSTAIAYGALSFTMAFLGMRFFQYWREKRDTTSKLFFFLALALLSLGLVRAITTFFFIDDVEILKDSITAVAFTEGLAAAIVAFLIIHLKLPRMSPWLGFWLIFVIGTIISIVSIFLPYVPFIEENTAVNWGFPEGLTGTIYLIFRTAIIFLTFLPLVFIMSQQFREAKDSFLKKRTLGLISALLLALATGFIDFILNDIFHFGTIYRDYSLIILSVILFFVIFFTQKPEQFKNTNA